MHYSFVKISFFLFLLPLPLFLSAEDLWTPGSLYRQPEIPDGTILKLVVNDPVEIEFEYENIRSDESSVEGEKGRGSMEFIPANGFKKTISGKKTGRLKAKGNLRLQMAVSVIRKNEAGMLVIRGKRVVVREAEDTEMVVEVEGTVHPRDVSADRKLGSAQIADLSLIVRGVPVERRTNFAVKVTEDEEGNPTYTPELSDEEKAKILMDSLNRALGESGYTP